MIIKGSPKGRRPPKWSLTHLGSGRAVCRVEGKVSVAFAIASEIADCGDWSFDGLNGYINIDRELPEKTKAIMEKYAKAISRGGGQSNETAARAIAIARA